MLQEMFTLFADHEYFDKHSTITYEWLIEAICDIWDNDTHKEEILDIIKKHTSELRDRKLKSVLCDEKTNDALIITIPKDVKEMNIFIKEEIMQANFGNTTFDW